MFKPEHIQLLKQRGFVINEQLIHKTEANIQCLLWCVIGSIEKGEATVYKGLKKVKIRNKDLRTVRVTRDGSSLEKMSHLNAALLLYYEERYERNSRDEKVSIREE